MKYYRRLLLREERFGLLGRLLNEYVLDMFSRVEDERLATIRFGVQKRIARRRDVICETIDGGSRTSGGPTSTTGKKGKVYLPSSFIGSARHMKVLRQDALELCRRLGPPTYFITSTCNPAWPEIQELLQPGQDGSHRPDLIARVFYRKLLNMRQLLLSEHSPLGKAKSSATTSAKYDTL